MKQAILYPKWLFSSIGSVLMLASALAEDVRINIEPQLISLFDRAVLKIEFIDTKGEAVDFPEIAGINIQYQGQSSETRIVNFKSSSKVIHTYLVTPSKIGDYTIGPVTVKFKGGKKELTARLRVIKPKDDKQAQEFSQLMFSRISSDRKAPYIQEPFNLTLQVFIRDGVQIDGNFSIQGGLPESGMDGKLQWKVKNRERQEVNGAVFNVYTFSTVAKALTTGSFSFQPRVRMNMVIPRQKRRPYGFDDPFFGDLFGRQETRPVLLDCNTLEINVHPIPMQNRPESFTGGVGAFDFEVEIGPKQVKAGEPITVKMRILGKGNLSKIVSPRIAESHNFKLYEARSITADSPNEVCFEQVLIPQSGSVTNIPPISFSYFHTGTANFRTITQGPFPVSVEAVPQRSARVVAAVPGTVQQETEVLGRDIVYLKPMPKNWKKETDRVWYRTYPFSILLHIPAFLLLLAASVSVRRNRLANDVVQVRRRQAPKAARRHVQRAGQAVREGNCVVFHTAAWDAFTAYFSHRLNLSPGEINLPDILERVSVEQEEAIRKLFDSIEQRRYGIKADTTTSKEEMRSLLNELTQTLRQCERDKR